MGKGTTYPKIAVDFDGTCVMHEYPAVGEDVPYAVESLKELYKYGYRFILWTMRSGPELDAAVAWFAERGIPLYGVNTNPDQTSWTSSPKAYAYRYIDDAAVGCPLLFDFSKPLSRAYVDWTKVMAIFRADQRYLEAVKKLQGDVRKAMEEEQVSAEEVLGTLT